MDLTISSRRDSSIGFHPPIHRRLVTKRSISDGVHHSRRLALTKEKKKFKPRKHQVMWRILSLVALMVTIASCTFVILSFTLENWEVIEYKESKIRETAQSHGYQYNTYNNYYTLTLPENEENVTYALSKTINNGMWMACDTVLYDTRKVVTNQGSEWLMPNCINYSSLGESVHYSNSPQHRRHALSRHSQACMIVSSGCLLTALVLGLCVFFLGRLLLCIVTSTISFASALYQMFVAVLMMERMKELWYLESSVDEQIRELVTLQDNSAGPSMTFCWLAMGTAIINGVMWLIIFKYLKHDLKMAESSLNY